MLTQASSVLQSENPPIKIIEDRFGMQAVSARELHKFVESSERFSKWVDRMFEYGFTEEVDYTPYQKVHPLNKQQFQDYALSMDTAKEIAMIQRNEKGRIARRYFIECEKKLKQVVAIPANQTALIGVVNNLLEEVVGLRSKIDRIHKARVKYFKAKIDDRRKKEYEENRINALQKRDIVVKKISNYVNQSAYMSWRDFWDRFQREYALNIYEYTRYKGEHLADVAVRVGIIDKVHEFTLSYYAKY